MGGLTKYCINFLACHDACLHKSALGYKVSVLMKMQLLPPSVEQIQKHHWAKTSLFKSQRPSNQAAQGQELCPSAN